ncbi:flagellar basal body L-ring protein FlgH [Azospirillum sp. SYSU D00513]|uniref:flagellar basal body L-ring protein FlgH n=1 Tax=Azospirillum sp. SYSU D00513 TaxID=2812561 RepID=UPI001A960800|nr:flagellar basal body L-ring protein FlgH [Azospirillum sp. SYSU D00513]
MNPIRTVSFALFLAALGGCGRFDHLGQPPTMTPVGPDAEGRALTEPVRLAAMPMPMPTPLPPGRASRNPGSVWQPVMGNPMLGQRASRVGDILTVIIDIDEQASFQNQTSRTRNASEGVSVPGLFGLQNQLPGNAESLVDIGSDSTSRGVGTSRRQEQVETKIAAVITEVLPNGNYVIRGQQEVRVNYDMRVLHVAGVVRPQDIRANNTVTGDKIAEARIGYGGRGQIMDLQQPRYGQQVLDIVLPW